VKRLEAAGAYERALVRLRAVRPESLNPGEQIVRATWIEDVTKKQTEAYAADRKKASELEAAGKFGEAAAALERVPAYGSGQQVAEAHAEKVRLQAAGAKAEADAKVRAEDEKKKRAAGAEQDQKEAKKAVEKWLAARKSLTCSTCNGRKVVKCKTCEGSGKVQGMAVGGRPIGAPQAPKRWIDCTRCGADGEVTCLPDSCGGRGFSPSRLAKVLWDAWPGALRGDIEKHVSAEPVSSSPPLVDACFEVLADAVGPIKGFEKIDVSAPGEDGVVTASYRVRLVMDERREETRWKRGLDPKGEPGWFLVPPPTAPAAAPQASPGAAKKP
jgi:hypothetical protein